MNYMNEDIYKYGDVQFGTYKDIVWYMKRHKGKYWRGYVRLDNDYLENLKDDELSNFNKSSGSEICGVYVQENFTDYMFTCMNEYLQGEYKDYEYVYGRIRCMIDSVKKN